MQIKDIDINTLIGYIGGYIGLILGYSILQIPDYLVVSIRKVKSYYSYNPAILNPLRPAYSWKKESDILKNQTKGGPNFEVEVARIQLDMKEELNRIRTHHNGIV